MRHSSRFTAGPNFPRPPYSALPLLPWHHQGMSRRISSLQNPNRTLDSSPNPPKNTKADQPHVSVFTGFPITVDGQPIALTAWAPHSVITLGASCSLSPHIHNASAGPAHLHLQCIPSWQIFSTHCHHSISAVVTVPGNDWNSFLTSPDLCFSPCYTPVHSLHNSQSSPCKKPDGSSPLVLTRLQWFASLRAEAQALPGVCRTAGHPRPRSLPGRVEINKEWY